LESWNDFEPRQGAYSFSQPTIAPLFQGRQAQESLLQWAGASAVFHDYMKQNWSSKGSWEKLIQDGVLENTPTAATSYACKADLNAAVASAKAGNGMELVIYEKTGLGNGVQANNPWLQELPDPITKITWDNYVTVAPSDAREKGWRQGNVVAVKAGNVTAKLPVVVQPGQAAGSIGVALGYGRTIAGKVADTRGVNVYPMVAIDGTNLSYNISGVSVDKTTDDDYLLAGTQTHHTMMGREIVKETTLASWQKDPKAGNPEEMLEVHVGHEKTEKPVEKVTLWDEFESGHHHWGMSIDLNSCIGCGSCVVACSAENNVPVVGKEEVMRSREMHWMRIDRYYSSDADPKEGEKGDINLMEVPSDNPRVVFQPVMCQHCNHAPCETVCPVIATSHSSEGMNQMTYNRCVGTRYCANNCPYKVRRFNWFKYSDNSQFASVNTFMNDDLGKMVLNPDVTVRSRGVMEKCSLCV
ncbi:MAG: 4Fe-4S dicluster domain-containing protein, partial [Bacteroidota bacterium]